MTHRAALLVLLLVLAGCSGSPADLGITGPGVPAPVQPPQDDNIFDPPTLQLPGPGYGPDNAPGPGDRRFYNYN